MIGTVVEWRDFQGFGFVAVEGHAGTVFLHKRQVANGSPRQGQRVRLVGIKDSSRGPRALGVAEILEDEATE
jgi:cold shock CspA family protein